MTVNYAVLFSYVMFWSSVTLVGVLMASTVVMNLR
jgi:hypothetical protein